MKKFRYKGDVMMDEQEGGYHYPVIVLKGPIKKLSYLRDEYLPLSKVLEGEFGMDEGCTPKKLRITIEEVE